MKLSRYHQSLDALKNNLQGVDVQGVKPYHGQSDRQVKPGNGPPQKERCKF